MARRRAHGVGHELRVDGGHGAGRERGELRTHPRRRRRARLALLAGWRRVDAGGVPGAAAVQLCATTQV